MARLIAPVSPERETAVCRDLYLRREDLECVWTGRALDAASLAIDHVLRYSLWRNNDLWNLLPAHRRVNGEKSDMLPSRAILRARRDPILRCWSQACEVYPTRFAVESRAQTGLASLDLADLFDAVLESMEITALQRACPRWEP